MYIYVMVKLVIIFFSINISSFEIITGAKEDGSMSFSIEEVPPGGQVTLNVTVIPKLYGMYESTRARIKYMGGTPPDVDIDSLETMGRRSGYSTSLGKIKILSQVEYMKMTSYYVKEWVLLIGIYTIIGFLPMYFWLFRSSDSK